VGLNTKQKAACAVLGLAAVALCVDKFALGSGALQPASAEAAPAAPPAKVKGGARHVAAAGRSLTARLAALNPPLPAPAFGDAFQASPAWFAAPAVAGPVAVQAASPLPVFKLTGVMKDVAVINGKVFKVGTSFDESTPGGAASISLLAVDTVARTATLIIGDRVVEIRVDDDKLGKAENNPRAGADKP